MNACTLFQERQPSKQNYCWGRFAYLHSITLFYFQVFKNLRVVYVLLSLAKLSKNPDFDFFELLEIFPDRFKIRDALALL